MKNSNIITIALNVIGIISAAILKTNDLDPTWVWVLAVFLIFLQIIPHIKWKKIEKEKEPD